MTIDTAPLSDLLPLPAGLPSCVVIADHDPDLVEAAAEVLALSAPGDILRAGQASLDRFQTLSQVVVLEGLADCPTIDFGDLKDALVRYVDDLLPAPRRLLRRAPKPLGAAGRMDLGDRIDAGLGQMSRTASDLRARGERLTRIYEHLMAAFGNLNQDAIILRAAARHATAMPLHVQRSGMIFTARTAAQATVLALRQMTHDAVVLAREVSAAHRAIDASWQILSHPEADETTLDGRARLLRATLEGLGHTRRETDDAGGKFASSQAAFEAIRTGGGHA